METVKSKELKKEKQGFQNKVLLYKSRMLVWDSPVEYVNNMYGCHPDIKNEDYFDIVFKNEIAKY